MLDAYMAQCAKWTAGRNKRVATEAYLSLCDLCITFSRHLATSTSNIRALAYSPDANTEAALVRFLENFVFVDVSCCRLCLLTL